MAKHVKEVILDVDVENEERAKYAGMLKAEIKTAASAIRTQKAKSSELSGTLSGKLGIFEKQGGHKSALKTAVKVTNMEPAECADWMRSFLGYFDALGGNDQIDMFDQQAENEKRLDGLASVSKPKKAEAEPSATVQ